MKTIVSLFTCNTATDNSLFESANNYSFFLFFIFCFFFRIGFNFKSSETDNRNLFFPIDIHTINYWDESYFVFCEPFACHGTRFSLYLLIYINGLIITLRNEILENRLAPPFLKLLHLNSKSLAIYSVLFIQLILNRCH